MTLEEASNNIGRSVIYTPTSEQGIITSVNAKYVFVKYGYGGTSQATNPDDLKY